MNTLSRYITEALYEPYILLAADGLRKASSGKIILGKNDLLSHIPLGKITPADRTVYDLPKDLRKAKEAVGGVVRDTRTTHNALVIAFKGDDLDSIYTGVTIGDDTQRGYHTIAFIDGSAYVQNRHSAIRIVSTIFNRDIDRVVVYDPKVIGKLMEEGSKKADRRKDSQAGATAMTDPAEQLSNNRRRYGTFVAFKNADKFRDNIDRESKKPRQVLDWVIDNLDGLLSCSNEWKTVEMTNDVITYIHNFFSQACSVGRVNDSNYKDNTVILDHFVECQKENKYLLPKVSRAMSSRPSGSLENSYYLREYIPKTKKALKLLRDKFDWATEQLCEQETVGIFNYVKHLCDSAKSLIELSYYLYREPDENWNDKYTNPGTAKMKLDDDLYVASQDIKSFL